MNKEGNYENPEYKRKVYKVYNERKVADIIREEVPRGEKVLIVFWHGLGDLLMFLPIYEYLQTQLGEWHFDLAGQPGVGHKEVYNSIFEFDESQFVRDHHTAFVINFPMIEGAGVNSMTKAEYCCEKELGIPRTYLGVYNALPVRNLFIGMHLQGTCLPGSTNPDEAFAKQIWEDVRELGYIPIDTHFEHSFHNPANIPYSWQARACRDLKPSLRVLQSVIQQCHIFIGVASGPWVMAVGMMPRKTIYLQKSHGVECYLKGFDNVLKISEYSADALYKLIMKINSETLY